MPSPAVQTVLERLQGVKPLQAGWVAKCPAHKDGSPSLKIDEGTDGRVLLRYHAGCGVPAIVAALQLTMRDLMPPDDAVPFSPARAGHTRHLQVVGNTAIKADPEPEPDLPPKWEWPEVARYDYTDEDGAVLFAVVRRELQGRKTFMQEQPNGTRGLKGVDARPLYRLPAVRSAVASGEIVLLVEGEKDADTGSTLGYVATTNVGGANSWNAAHHVEPLRNANVVVIPDADAPGRAWAQHVCETLLGTAAQVRVVSLPGVGEKGDLTDWVTAGGTEAALAGLILRAPSYHGGDIPVTDYAPSRFRVYSAAELADLPPRTWLVDDLVPTDALVALVGPSGVGKTFVTLDLACSIGVGTPWLGHGVGTAAPVLYIAAEGTAGLRARVAAWAAHHGTRLDALPLGFICETVNLMDAEDPTHVLRAMARMPVPPACVVIDTLHRAMPGGDENSAKDVGVVIAAADRIRRMAGCTVVLIHHSRKDSDVERGSTALRAACDTLLLLKDEDGTLSMEVEKQKDAAAAAPLGLQLHEAHGSLVVESLAGTSAGDRVADPANLTKREYQALKALEEMSTGSGLTATTWLEVSNVPKATFFRALKRLVGAGLVVETARGGRYIPSASGRGAVAYASNPANTAGLNLVPFQSHSGPISGDSVRPNQTSAAGRGSPPKGGIPPYPAPHRSSQMGPGLVPDPSRRSGGASARRSDLDGPPSHVLDGPVDDGPEPWWQR